MARSFSARLGGAEAGSSAASRSGVPDALLQQLSEVHAAVPGASGGLIYVSGPLARRVTSVAERVRAVWRGVPACVVPAAAVVSERGDIEGESGASGVLWAGGRACAFALPDEIEPSAALDEALTGTLGRRSGTAVLFARPDAVAPEALVRRGDRSSNACVFGAVTGGGPASCLTADGEIRTGAAVGLALAGLAPLVEASPGCRLLGGFEPIEEVRAGLVLRVGGRAALDLLSSSTSGLTKRTGAPPMLYAALADPPSDTEETEEDLYVVRPLRGVDPARRGVMIGDGAVPGARLAFAVREAAAARAGVEAMALRTSRSALGSAPRFALYLGCAGSGQGLYGAPDVEARILRQRFADLPIAGMRSAFVIVPWEVGGARLAACTGLLALFRAPS